MVDTPLASFDSYLVIGSYAQDLRNQWPGRVVHSAKSWLGVGFASFDEPILPWDSEDLVGIQKVSPFEVSRQLLRYLACAWNAQMAWFEPTYALDQQVVVLTVPASFSSGACEATLEAAHAAGFPKEVLLIEEPLAAFYQMMVQPGGGKDILGRIPENSYILVCDVGGGTTDFTLLKKSNEQSQPYERIKVSQHILLGGDNIDLAIAGAMERKLTSGQQLSPDHMAILISEARKVKERVLAQASGASDQQLFHVTLPGQSSDLFASVSTLSISGAEVSSLIYDGFFPSCRKEERPIGEQSGLQEFGLPYAKDTAVTKYLAVFLSDCEKIDAIVFAGGTFAAEGLRERVTTVVKSWQEAPLAILPHGDFDRAVSRGACVYGQQSQQKKVQVKATYPRSVFVLIEGEKSACFVSLRKEQP